MIVDTHTSRAISGAALAPLSREQKRELVLVARRAYEALKRVSGSPDQSFEDWRHQQQKMAVERESLTVCTNEDFLFLTSHFLRLAGKPQAADKTMVRAGCEPRIWALHRFERECREAADVLPHAREYGAGFLRNARGVSIEDASEKMIWHAIYVVRRRATQLRRRLKNEAN